jgi:NTP pyrophosphatase (non-canonical NTP hydrolase)
MDVARQLEAAKKQLEVAHQGYFDEYSFFVSTKLSTKPAGDHTTQLLWMSSELMNEASEVSEIFSKMTRNNGEVSITGPVRQKVEEELGDVLFWVQAVANKFGTPLDVLIELNMMKLTKRVNEVVVEKQA